MDLCPGMGEFAYLDGSARGLTIRCLSGRLWFTQSGESRDHVLAQGQEFAMDR